MEEEEAVALGEQRVKDRARAVRAAQEAKAVEDAFVVEQAGVAVETMAEAADKESARAKRAETKLHAALTPDELRQLEE